MAKSIALRNAETTIAQLTTQVSLKTAEAASANSKIAVLNTRIEELELALANKELPSRVTQPFERLADRECEKCAGSGLFRGKYACYRCAGKGVRSADDQRRTQEGTTGKPAFTGSFAECSAFAKEQAKDGRKVRLTRIDDHLRAVYVV
jgi:DnaJ-class molecular chaperone